MRPIGKYSKNAYKERVFEEYKRWKRLPAFLKGLTPFYLRSVYNITDERIVGLLQITTQQEFARMYGIGDLGTLTDWNERIGRENFAALDPEVRRLTNRLYKHFLGALYVRCLIHAKASDVRLWFKHVENWKGPSRVNKRTDGFDGKMPSRQKEELDKLIASANNGKLFKKLTPRD